MAARTAALTLADGKQFHVSGVERYCTFYSEPKTIYLVPSGSTTPIGEGEHVDGFAWGISYDDFRFDDPGPTEQLPFAKIRRLELGADDRAALTLRDGRKFEWRQSLYDLHIEGFICAGADGEYYAPGELIRTLEFAEPDR